MPTRTYNLTPQSIDGDFSWLVDAPSGTFVAPIVDGTNAYDGDLTTYSFSDGYDVSEIVGEPDTELVFAKFNYTNFSSIPSGYTSAAIDITATLSDCEPGTFSVVLWKNDVNQGEWAVNFDASSPSPQSLVLANPSSFSSTVLQVISDLQSGDTLSFSCYAIGNWMKIHEAKIVLSKSYTFNKVVFGNQTLIDLSNITVAPNKLAQGYTAIDKNGVQITGTLDPGGGGGGATPYTLSVSLDDCTITGSLEFRKEMPSGTYAAAKAAYDSGARVDLALSGGNVVPGNYFTNGTQPLTAYVQVFQWIQLANITFDGSSYTAAYLFATLSSSDVFTVSMVTMSSTVALAIEDATRVSEYEFMYNLPAVAFRILEKMLTAKVYPRVTLTMGGTAVCDCFIKTSGHDSNLNMEYIEGEALFPNYPSQGTYVLFDAKAFSDNTLHLYITDLLVVSH